MKDSSVSILYIGEDGKLYMWHEPAVIAGVVVIDHAMYFADKTMFEDDLAHVLVQGTWSNN